MKWISGHVCSQLYLGNAENHSTWCMLDVDLGSDLFRFQQTTQIDRHLLSLTTATVYGFIVKSSKGK